MCGLFSPCSARRDDHHGKKRWSEGASDSETPKGCDETWKRGARWPAWGVDARTAASTLKSFKKLRLRTSDQLSTNAPWVRRSPFLFDPWVSDGIDLSGAQHHSRGCREGSRQVKKGKEIGMAPSRCRRSGGGASPPLSRVRKRGCAPGARACQPARRQPGRPPCSCRPLCSSRPHSGVSGRIRQMWFYLCFSLLFKSGRKATFGEMVLISGRNSHADTCGPADLKPICRRFCSSLPCFLKDGCGKCYSAFKRGPHIKKSSLGGSRLKSLHTSLEMKTRTRRPLGQRPAPGCGRAGGDPIALHTDFLLMACVTSA